MKTALDLAVAFPDKTTAFGRRKICNRENVIGVEVAVQVTAQSQVTNVSNEVLKIKPDTSK